MAKDNRLWGAERIRGELLKLGLRVCKRTIQKYMRNVRTHQPRGQTWATDLAQPRRTDLGLRLLTSDRSLLSTALCVLHRRTEVETGDPCRRDTLADGCLGGTTASGSHPVWARAEVSDS
jgi:hypothetical protein